MSRSNPSEHGAVNPARRWFEWNGEAGSVRYYDKDAKQNVDVGPLFAFVLLDQLGSVRGWHEPSASGIYSNEVKDTRADVLVVKAFKGGTLAEGIYRDIKDKINSVGGQFVANLYIGFKLDGTDGLTLGSIRFKGAALGAWMEFTKAHRSDLYSKAILIDGFEEGKKGRVIFRTPVLKLKPMSEAANNQAIGLDVELQTYLKGYLNRNTVQQVEAAAEAAPVARETVRTESLDADDVPIDETIVDAPYAEDIGF